MFRLSWDDKYNLLIEYLENHNGEYPKATEVYKDVKLGSWIFNQRNAYKCKKLSQEKIDKLNSINFEWKHSGRKIKSTEWNKKYELLKEYLIIYNKYPKQNEYYKDVAIGIWINDQRKIYNNGDKQEDGSIAYYGYVLTKERIEKLNKINFRWESEFEFNWNKNYGLLQEYIKEHNGEYPKATEVYKDVKLGFWIITQRRIYNNGVKEENGNIRYGNHILAKEKIKKLNEINFKWKLDVHKAHDKNWDYKYHLLIEYIKNHNGRYPKAREIYKDVKLGSWVDTQRKVYNNGEELDDGSIRYKLSELTKDQIEKLNDINFKWYSYKHSDYIMSIKSKKIEELSKKKILYKLKKVLNESKNEIESKEDIEKIEKEFVKSLTMYI